MCHGLLSGGTLAPVQWLYPERRRTNSGATPGASDPHQDEGTATAGTLDPARPDQLSKGPRRVGRYELRGELGRGGVGVVYAAWDTELQRDVALKVLLAGGFASAEARRRFVAEARAAGGLHHVHIVRIFDMGEVEEQPWFAMERVFGPSLEEVIASGGPLPLEEAARIGAAVAAAVAHAHAAGVAHRDLKPGNVLLDGDGHPRIADFGLARSLTDARQLTATAQILGTPSYMPPEVARTEAKIDWIRADVYGLGALLYAAITGRPPVDGLSLNERLSAAASGRRAPLRRLRPEVPPALDAIVSKAMDPEVPRRYPTAAALAEDLRLFLAGEPVHARPETALERGRRWARRHATRLALGLLVVATVGVALSWAPAKQALARRQREASAARAWEGLQSSLGTPEGEALLDELLRSDAYRGTTAVAQAWLRRGDDLAQEPHPVGEFGEGSTEHVDAWARALTEAPDTAVRGQALLRLAQEAKDRFKHADLRTLLDALAALPAGTVSEEQRVTLELEYALNSGDRRHAVSAWERAKAMGLPIADRVMDPRWTPPGLGAAERLELPQGAARFITPEGGGSPVAIVTVGDRLQVYQLTPTVRALGPAEVAALRLSEFRLQDGELKLDLGARSVAGDVDGDGAQERYRALAREVCRFSPDESRCEPILPEVIRTNAEVMADLGDLDADGRDELIVGLAEWRGYDLRVYSASDGGFRLRDRAQRGAPCCLLTLADPWRAGRLIIAGEHTIYPNAYKFGDDHPQGPAPAVVVRRLVGDKLDELFVLPLPGNPRSLFRADLDGDGREELLAGVPQGEVGDPGATAVSRSGETPGFSSMVIQGAEVVGVGQLDEDAAAEVIVERLMGFERPEYWIWGRGTQAYPAAQPPAPSAPLEAPEGALDGPLAQVWRDASLLVSVSQAPSAARLLQRAASLARDADTAAAASGLWEGLQQYGPAAKAAEVAARSSEGASARAHWESAVRLHLSGADPDAALHVAERWRQAEGQGPTGALAAQLAAWQRARTTSLVFDPTRPIDAPWQVEEPLAIEQRGGETWLNLYGGGSPVLQAPLRALGGPVALIFDARVDQQEWRAAVRVGLAQGPEQKVGFKYELYGAERAHFPLLECRPWPWLHNHGKRTLPPGGSSPLEPVALRLRLTWTPEDQTWRCTVAMPDHHQSVTVPLKAEAPTDLTLQLEDHGAIGELISLRLDRLEVWGVAPTDTALDPRQRANLALLHQDPAAALALLPPGALTERAVAQAALRRPVEAMQTFSKALDQDHERLQGRLPYLLRAYRASLAPLIRAASGARWPRLFERVYYRPIIGNRPIPDVDDALRAELEDVVLPMDPEDRVWWLMARRVGALLRGPDPSRGRLAAAQWLQALDALQLPRTHELWHSAFTVHFELALAAAAAGELEEAKRQAQVAVDRSPTPVVAPDRFAASAEWRQAGLPLPVAHPWD